MTLSAGLALLALAMGASSCQRSTGPEIKPLGYLTAKELSGGGGTLRPKEEGKTFVVIVADVPVQLLMPTEAEYQSILAEDRERKKDDKPATDKGPLPRDRYRLLDPQRFTVVLADGRGQRAVAITTWEFASAMGFHDGTLTMSIMQAKSGAKDETSVKLAVAVVVNEAEAKPPFMLQLDRDLTRRVPDKVLKLP
jgi:hypothetical protein